jgi:hypothetical protein
MTVPCPERTIGFRVAARLAACLALWGLADNAAAQQVNAGATTELATFFVRGVDTAYDPNTDSYLVVGGYAGALVGICINASGVPITGPITINSSGHVQFPRARYSPQIFGSGGFLVTWPQEVGATIELRARVVSCSGALGAEQVISGGHSAWLESGAAVAYSPASQQFLVVWKSFPPVHIKATMVNTSGTRISGVVDLSSGFGRDPGVTWNSHTNEFGVSFSGETGDSANPINYSGFAVVPAANPAAFRRTTFNTFQGGMNSITDVDFNPVTGRYIMTWFELSSGLYARVAEFDAGANIVSSGVASTRVGSYDALSVAYNRVSGTFLLAGVDRTNDATVGVELNYRGFPFNGENTLSASHRESWYTRVTSRAVSKTWNAVFTVRKFAGIGSVIATSFASGGGSSGSFDAPAPSPSTPTSPTVVNGGCTTIQPGPGWICQNGGWLPPPDPTVPTTTLTTTLAPPPLSPTGCTTIQPGSDWVCVNGGWLPPTQPAPSTTTSAPPPPPPVPSSTGCTTIQPGSDWVCVNGGWLPPGMAPAAPSAPVPASTPATSAGCVGVAPVAGWLCIRGGWIPPDHPLALSGGGNEP